MSTRETDKYWLNVAIDLSRKCPKTDMSFAVGAVLLDRSGQLISTGYSLELGPGWHAEEVALHKAAERQIDPAGGTIYCSLEPCSIRLSGKTACAEHAVKAGVARVVFALKEPPVFVSGTGMEYLETRGIEVFHLPEFGVAVEDINRHLLGD
jgi:pyrimidine deaminase RibD-like protein